MKHFKPSAREISYAYSAQTFSGKAFIKILENVTGRISLIKRAQGYERELESGDNFFNIMFRRYGLSLEILDGAFGTIPQKRSANISRKPSFWYFGWINSWLYFVEIAKRL